MKRLIHVTALCLLVLPVSCQRQVDERDNGSGLPIQVETAVKQKGKAIAEQGFGVLSSRLGKIIEEVGLTNAIEFCSVHGLALTTSVGVTNQVVLRRVSHRARNTQNRADTNEVNIIRQAQAELDKGTTPGPVVRADKPGVVTFYAPIVLGLPLCLDCHGQPGADIHEDVMAQIQKTYPQDAAIGFQQGQVRGLWRVDFNRSDFMSLEAE